MRKGGEPTLMHTADFRLIEHSMSMHARGICTICVHFNFLCLTASLGKYNVTSQFLWWFLSLFLYMDSKNTENNFKKRENALHIQPTWSSYKWLEAWGKTAFWGRQVIIGTTSWYTYFCKNMNCPEKKPIDCLYYSYILGLVLWHWMLSMFYV